MLNLVVDLCGIKSFKNNYNMKKLLFLVAVFMFGLSSIFSQNQQISEKDLKEIEAQMSGISAKIEQTLKKDEKLYLEMKKDIEALHGLKITKDLNIAIEIYQKKYTVLYGQILAKAGVNMKNLVNQLNAQYKNYKFTLNNTYSIKYVASSQINGGFALPTMQNTTVTETIEFSQSKQNDCALLGFSDVIFEPMSVLASTTAAGAGECIAKGTISKELKIPKDAKSCVLKLKGRRDVVGYAVGVVGGAATFANNNLWLSGENSGAPLVDILSINLMAPLFWIAKDKLGKEFSLEVEVAGDLLLSGTVLSQSSAYLCCSTTSESKISFSKAELAISK